MNGELRLKKLPAHLPITEMIPQLVQKAIDEGTSRMLRELKIQLGQ